MKAFLDRLSIRNQLVLVVLLLLTAGVAAMPITLRVFRVADQNLRAYQTAMGLQEQMRTLSGIYSADLVHEVYQVRHGFTTLPEGLDSVRQRRTQIQQAWAGLQGVGIDPGLAALYADAERAKQRADQALDGLEAALGAGDAAAVGHLADHDLYPALYAATRRVDSLATAQLQHLEAANLDRTATLSSLRNARFLLVAGFFLALLILLAAIARNVAARVEDLMATARIVEKMDFTSALPPAPRGELGEVAQALAQIRKAVQRYALDLQTAKESLGRNEGIQQALLDAALVSIVSVDLEGIVTGMNPFAERILGYEASEVVGQHTPLLWHDPQEIAAIAAEMTEQLGEQVEPGLEVFTVWEKTPPKPREWTYIRKDGTRIPVMLALSDVHDADSRKIGRMGVATDPTLLKLLERELRLREAEAQEANRAKSDFLATMTHEVRTPLIGILGTLEVLSHTSLNDEQLAYTGILRQSANALMRIIGDILDFSKIESGKLELSLHTVALRRLVEEEISGLASTAGVRGLRLTWKVHPQVAEAHLADGMRVGEILRNFLSNSLKFTDRGSVDLTVSMLDQDGDRQTLAFQVKDTGIGISKEHQISLFRPFMQAETTTTRRFGGTGLGLAISLRLAQLMGGSIRMESTEGLGTTMTFTASFGIGRAQDGDSTEDLSFRAVGVPRTAPTGEEAEREGSLILLVEDHPINRQILVRQLELAGFAVETAANGEEALDCWESGRFSLILTDINMPHMNGYQLASAIRFHESQRGMGRIPILALTANALQDEPQRCLNSGMDDCLIKPVSIPELVARLRPWFPDLVWNPVEAQAEARALNQDVLNGLASGSPEGEASILVDFIATTHKDLEAVARAQAVKDSPDLARQAHRIKGASRMVGADELAQAAERLEKSAVSGDWNAAAVLISRLHAALARLEKARP